MSYLFPSWNLLLQHGQSRRNTTKIVQFADKYQILVIVPQQIYRYILTKLQLMSVPVFRCVSGQHYRFEKKKKMVTHLIMKI